MSPPRCWVCVVWFIATGARGGLAQSASATSQHRAAAVAAGLPLGRRGTCVHPPLDPGLANRPLAVVGTVVRA